MSRPPSTISVAYAAGRHDERAEQAAWRRDMATVLIALGDAIARAGEDPDLVAAYSVVSRVFSCSDHE
ncbi:hypothetical protein A4G85_13975 [Burkholderia pseudomallei]|nr:hypothetical protein A4G85_13975 [Burkholderia pseudomallei]